MTFVVNLTNTTSQKLVCSPSFTLNAGQSRGATAEDLKSMNQKVLVAWADVNMITSESIGESGIDLSKLPTEVKAAEKPKKEKKSATKMPGTK